MERESEQTTQDAAEFRTIYTIGHSNHPLETFFGLLRSQRIELLVDTRSAPYSRYATQYNMGSLKPAVAAAGLRYFFLGRELGGKPEGAEFYDPAGYALYGRIAETADFQRGIETLLEKAAAQRVAIFCSEENPLGCHRRRLVGRVLAGRGLEMRHIRGDGRVQTEAELIAEENAARNAGGQQALFETHEVGEWKSLQSVLPKKAPPNSSER